MALWCFGTPPWYQKFIWDEVSKRIGTLRAEQIDEAIEKDVARAVAKLARKLRELDALYLFLLEDGEILAQAYEKLGGSAIRISFGRKNIPTTVRMRTYFSMFDLVNSAASASGQDWHSFRYQYDSLWTQFVHSEAGAAATKSLHKCVDSKVRKTVSERLRIGQPIICVDSGMQGTFSLALSSWLANQFCAPLDRFDIRLLVVYPWLQKVFRNRFITTNPDILAGLEKLLKVS